MLDRILADSQFRGHFAAVLVIVSASDGARGVAGNVYFMAVQSNLCLNGQYDIFYEVTCCNKSSLETSQLIGLYVKSYSVPR